jgi:hypothetical protein
MRKLWICLVTLVFVSGCMSIDLQSSFAQPASLTNVAGKEYTIGTHFSREFRVFFLVNGAIRLTDTNAELDKILTGEVRSYDGDGVVNLRGEGRTERCRFATLIRGLHLSSICAALGRRRKVPHPWFLGMARDSHGVCRPLEGRGMLLTGLRFPAEGELARYVMRKFARERSC